MDFALGVCFCFGKRSDLRWQEFPSSRRVLSDNRARLVRLVIAKRCGEVSGNTVARNLKLQEDTPRRDLIGTRGRDFVACYESLPLIHLPTCH